MGFPALELLERREIGVLVVERDDEAERDLAIGLVIEEAAAPCVAERPALGVDHPARNMLCRVDVPQLFQSDSIDLRSTVRLKVEDALQFLRQVPARALREKRRSEEHTSELQSLMRTSYAVFC